MRVQVRFFGNDQRRACKDPEIAEIIARDMCSPWLVWGTAKAERYVKAFETGAGCEMRTHFDLTWPQARKYDFQVLTPKHVINESHTVAAANRDYADTLPIHHETDFGSFKVRDKLFVDKIKPYSDRIWSMEYCEGFIASEVIADRMLANFTGIQEARVLHHRTHDPLPGWKAWFSDQWLSRLVADETNYLSEGLGWKYLEPLGLYAGYADDLRSMPDVFRLPQVYNKFGDSDYAVRTPVMEYWRDQRIDRSFYLQPLLVTGTEAYDKYLAMWREMRSRLSVNPRNKIA
ncbi:MAG: hypothetical protein QNJ19_16175 [Woeseiaceae bacterium]|nr:hypothetical protein [Woeseiaceae bacterium]